MTNTTPSLPLSAGQLDNLEALARSIEFTEAWDFDTADEPYRIAGGEVVGGDALPYGDVYTMKEWQTPDGSECLTIAHEVGAQFGRYIAAFDPPTILALIAQARTAQQATASRGEPLTDEELADPDYMRSYVAELRETIAQLANRASSAKAEPIGEVVQGGRCDLIPVRLNGPRPGIGAKLYAAATPASDTRAAVLLNAEEMAALRRFNETCEDGEGYDVRKDMMKRLATIGVVRRTSGSIYEITEFGMYVLDGTIASAVEKSWDRFTVQIERQSAAPTAAIAEADAKDEIARLERIIDGLLDHCPDPECLTCGEIICQYNEPLHFHHDGCPSCEQAAQQAQNSAKGSD
ncbi:hypothetical protein [Massilia sp. TN1-12]|uniref:hypothetical protein n=1 Tax=Massilia paldalensis TaxID=3377675 RepID=UPI00384E1E91